MSAGVRWAVLLACLGAAGGPACIPTQPRTVSLRMKGAVPDASVVIDDQYVGQLSYVQKRGVALPPGRHTITVERSGYFPWDRIVEAKDQRKITLEVDLQPIPD